MQDLINNTERMTSIEIAEVTGKQHKNVMQAIRNMEPAWEKVNGLKFQLVEYRDKKGELRPCYSLTKTECLYIATKFNDEARAKLVLRWEQLEMERINVEVRMPMPVHCLPTEKAMIAAVDDIRQDLISLENMDARPCYTITEVAMMLNTQRRTLNKLLVAQGIQTHKNGRYYIDDHYKGHGLCEERFFHYYALDGEKKERSYMVWTDRGVDFIKDLLESENLFGQ